MSKTEYNKRVEMSFYKPDVQKMGVRLAKLRENKGLSQQELVSQLNSAYKLKAQCQISRSTYRRCEEGTAFMNVELLFALCAFYHKSPNFIMYGDTESNNGDLLDSFSEEDAGEAIELFEKMAAILKDKFDFK